MDDFISLSKSPSHEEYDVLKLTCDDNSSPSLPTPDPAPVKESSAKPIYPSCKRVLTRAPFHSKQLNKKPKSDLPPPAIETPPITVETLPITVETTVVENLPVETPSVKEHVVEMSRKVPSVAAISLEQLMAVDESKTTTVPDNKRGEDSEQLESEKVTRLKNKLKHAEAETATLQGYVAKLQAKLAAAPKRQNMKCTETQTDNKGVTCPTCSTLVDPAVLLQSFGDDFSFDEENNKFVQKSSGFFYDPCTQLYLCQDSYIQYYWDAARAIYHYHSKVSTEESENADSEEEGELSDENSKPEDLTEVAETAMNASGVKFISSMNMFYNKNTGLYYCQSSGLYYDSRMSVFYTLEDGKYNYHSTAKPDDRKSAYAQTSIRAVVKESACHKVKPGMLYIFTCMGGSIGREGNHVAVFPEIRVSKRHATISYCSNKYYIIDEGTMNGTYLNGNRLSVQKEISDRHELSHLDEVRVGSTLLQLHIHTNLDTCKWCEPGLNNPTPACPATISEPPTLYKQRSKEMNRLKRKYKLMGNT